MSKDGQGLSTQEKLKLESWGLPKLILQKYIEKGITTMFPWQVECLCLPNVLHGGNLVYSAPTSAGKTLVAEILTIQTIIERRKKAFFILPFISVVREKMLYFKDLLKSSGVRVHGFMGSHSPPGGLDACNLAVCTIEKANGLINRLIEENSLEDVGCVVVDELHLLGDPHRGYLLELLLAKLRYVSKRESLVKVQIIGMSATLPNLPVLADWLEADLYSTDFRPVPLTEYLKVDSVIYRAHDMDTKSMTLPQFDIKDDHGSIITLCIDAILSGHSALVFCPSKNWCESLAQQIASEICKMGSSNTAYSVQLKEQLKSAEIADLLEQLRRCPVGLELALRKSVSFGVGYHHAGLTMDEREMLETSFRQCVLRVLVATSTLSSGVNLPARRVIVRSPMFGGRPLDVLTYKQMIGRAGRMGRDTAGESFLLCKTTERRVGEMLVKGNLPAVRSCLGLGDLSSSLKRAVLEVIASGVVSSLSDVEEYTACTLFAACHRTEPSNSMDEPISACLNFLKSNEFITISDDGQITPTSLGEACLSASLPPDQALRLLSELYKARQCFVLDSELHIIYQVTPFSVSEQWRQLDWMSAFALWEGLSASMQRVGEMVGVEERFLVRAIRGNINTNSSDQMEKLSIFRRFYTALALQDLVNEVPLVKVSEKYKCSKGMLQSLQQSSSTFAGMVTQFCKRLGWSSMELLVSQFADRLHFGVHRELIDLLRVDCMSAVQARALFNAKIGTLSKLATAKVEKVEKALRSAIPFESNKVEPAANSEHMNRKHIWLTGRSSQTEREAAHLLIREAREFLQAELGLETAKWTEESSLAIIENEGQPSSVNSNLDTNKEEAENSAEGSLTQFQVDERDSTAGDAVHIGLQPKTDTPHNDEMKIAEDDTILVTGNEENGAQDAILITGNEENGVQDAILITGNEENGVQDTILVTGNEENGVQDIILITGNEQNTDCRDKDNADDRVIENSQIFEPDVDSLSHFNAAIAVNCEKYDEGSLIPNEAEPETDIEFNKHQESCVNDVSSEVKNIEGNNSNQIDAGIKRVEENVECGDDIRELNGENTKSQKSTRHSIDLFESSCESSCSLNLEYTITPPPSTPTSTKNESIRDGIDRDIENQEAHTVENHEDLDMFENHEIDNNDNCVPAEKPKHEFKFPTQDGDFSLRDLNLSEEMFGRPDDTRRSDNLNDAVTIDDAKAKNVISLYEADTVLVETSQTMLPETSVNSPDVFSSNRLKLMSNVRVSTPLSNVNINRNIMNIFKHSPICDNIKSKQAVDIRPNSLEDMDSNWGGGSILENSFLFSVVETKKRKLSLPFEDDAKRLKTSHDVEQMRNNEMSILPDKQTNAIDHKLVDEREPATKKRRTSLFDSLSVDTQLFNVLDQFSGPGPSKLKTPPVEKTTPKNYATEIKEADNCDSISFDEDFIPSTPNDKISSSSNNYCSNKLSFLTKTQLKSVQDDDDDDDTVAGTPVEKCSSLLNKSISSIHSSRFSRKTHFTSLFGKSVVTNDCSIKNTEPAPVLKKSVSESVKPEEVMKPPIIMGPPSITVNRRHSKKRDSLLFPELHLKRQNGCRLPVNNELSSSLLEAAAGMQSMYEFNKTNINDHSSCHNSKQVSINAESKVDAPTTSDFNLDDYILSSQDDISLMSSGVYTRAMAAKMNSSSDVAVTSPSRIQSPCRYRNSDQPSTSKSVGTPSKKVTSPVNRKTQISNTDTTEHKCSESPSKKFASPVIKKTQTSNTSVTTEHVRSESPSKKFVSPVNKKAQTSNISVTTEHACSESPSKKFASPGNKKTQTSSLSVTTEHVCGDSLKLQHFEKELAKRRILAVGLDVMKQGESRSKSIGARILGNRSQTSDTSGDFCCGNTTLIGIAIYWGESSLYYLDLRKSDCPCVPIIKALFKQENITIVIYDLKPTIKLLKNCMGTDFWCEGSDPIIADWMFTPFSRCRSLQNMVKTNNIKCPQYDCNVTVGADTIKLWSLNLLLEKKLKQAELLMSYKSVEMPVQFTLSRMESIGFRFDREYAELLMDRVDIKMSELQETAFQIAQRKFNMRSKADLNKVLQLLGDTHEGENVLSETVKKWGKLYTLKTKSLGPFLLESGARLYGCYTTCTQTGRVSMKLQNVPKDLQIDDEVFSLRSAFLPSPGFVLISSDYCQLELRLLAHLSQDTCLLDAFRTCDDVFISIAASWHSIPDSQVTDEMRHHTKQICYGLIYGMGVTSLAEQLELTEADAREMMRSFEEAYPALQSYLAKVVAQCQATKQVRTILNRVRYLPDIASKNSSLRSQAERQAVNTTVQGSAADIAKLGMLKVERKLLNSCPGSNILLQLHDELIYEVPENHLEDAVTIIRTEMENTKTLSVPLPVKIKVGPSWGQLALYNFVN
ncbi:DNA polymerase theta [Nilaparvata lugens]|uniref:DNA polymerase theta n=1 Tax=Nilaparvata lugens TaxID=108931 RepID=UPI00193DFD12|nr:DNA polymerase theta [Nilaparvata lugens]